jgi:deoxyadenosine/deoxycytidine kinase
MRLISLEGNIGSGKSTLLRALSSRLCVFQEPIHEWVQPVLSDGRSMLKAFYDDPAKNGFAFQMYVLASRVSQMRAIAEQAAAEGPQKVFITERCLSSDAGIFAENLRKKGLMSDAEHAAYTAMFAAATLGMVHPQPSGIVYLRTSADVCNRRVNARHRTGESDMTVEYLRDMHDEHESYIRAMRENGVLVLELNGDQDGEQAVEVLASTILTWVHGPWSS